MSLYSDMSAALSILTEIKSLVNESGNEKLKANTNNDLQLLISVFQNPIIKTIASVQDSVAELSCQLQEHPSLLPIDFDISPVTGQLVLSLPSESTLYNSVPEDLDQRVPKLSNSSSTESSSTTSKESKSFIKDISTNLVPITTQSYALEFQKAVEEASKGRKIHNVQLFKPEGCSLGFSVVGLRSEEKGELGIFVQEIQQNGIAAREGGLHEGDQIIAIDGQPLDTNVSHQQAIGILQQARGLVQLVVARPLTPPPIPSSQPSTNMLNTEWAQVEVIELLNDGSGLGFGIIGGRSTGVVVKTILPGGVADRDGRLQSGDHILQIGEVNLRGMGSEQVAAVLRQSGSQVRLVVARPIESSAIDIIQNLSCSAPIVPTKMLGDAEELDRHLVQHGYPEVATYTQDYFFQNIPNENNLLINDIPSSLPILTMDMVPPDSITTLPETDSFTVQLKKDSHGLGITIAGYVCEKEELSGIFVKSISEGSAADLCKKIQVNDRIVEVDGTSLQGFTNHEAVEVLRSTGQVVSLRLERYLRGPKFEQLQVAIAASEMKPNTNSTTASPSLMSLPRFPITDGDSTAEIEVESESGATLEADILDGVEDETAEEINFADSQTCEGGLKPETMKNIKNKWNEIVGNNVEIVIGQLKKFSEGGGLGISLEGTVDVENGMEVRPHHYIRSVLPEGPVGKNGCLRSGDELLEVNGHRLLGRNHMEVVAILKELPMNVRMICARRSDEQQLPHHYLTDISEDRAAFAAKNALGGSLQNLMPATDRLVKAKSDGSLASTGTAGCSESSRLRSRSLEPLTGLAMWSSQPQLIELMKGERGLGFSILDYQDPMNPSETVIVIRSLVPGGVAQNDGRLIPGDRLLRVNDICLENASLDQAVQALKGAPKGVVQIAVAKPLPIPDSSSQDDSSDEKNLSNNIEEDDFEDCCSSYNNPKSPVIIKESKNDDAEIIVKDPKSTERKSPDHSLCGVQKIAVEKDSLPLGLCLRKRSFSEQVGLEVESLYGAAERDRRLKVGDIVVSVNNESLKYVSPAQVKTILSRANLLTGPISVKFIPAELLKDSIKVSRSKTVPNISLRSPRSPFVEFQVKEDCDSFQKKHLKTKSSKRLGTSSKSKSECTLCTKCHSVQRTNSWNDIVPLNDVSFENVINYYKVFNTSDEYVCAKFTSDQFIKKLDEKLLEESERLSELTQSVSAGSLLTSPDDDLDGQLLAETETLQRLTQNQETYPSSSQPFLQDNYNLLRLGSEDFGCFNGPPTRIYRFPSTGVALDRNDPTTAFTMTVTTGQQSLLAKHWGPQREVVVHRDSNNSLGISIVGGKVDFFNSADTNNKSTAVSGIFVKNVLPHSVASQLKTGDRILEVNGISLRYSNHEQAVEVIRSAKNPVVFLVQSLVYWSDSEQNINSSSSCSSIMDESSSVNQTIPVKPGSVKNRISSWQQKSIEHLEEPLQENQEKRKSSLAAIKKALSSFDSSKSIASNKSEESEEEDNRDNEGRIRIHSGQEIMRSSAGNVKRSKAEIDADPEQEDEFGYTLNKAKKKYGNLCGHSSSGHGKTNDSVDEEDNDCISEVLVVMLERSPGSGLGMSLAGHKDRTKMAVMVCGLNPNGPAAKSGCLRVGDEILEVNGIVLHGRCHLNASAIIKGIPGPIYKIVVLRKPAALDELAVRPIIQFPVTLDDETPEEKYANYKGLRVVTMKKPCISIAYEGQLTNSPTQQSPHGLGIMILEGKHAELGTGIFISDIQEGSPAEQAGLTVGDLILSVNKDTLLGSTYDAASSLLKKTEGVVTLVVCNPNRGKDDGKAITENKINDKPKQPEKPKSLTPIYLDQSVEPPPDPATASVKPGVESIIEINKDKMGLGLSIVGGSDTLLGVVIIHEVYPDGAAAKDGRLRPGDQLVEVNGEDFRNITHVKALSVLRQTPSKVSMVVLRDESCVTVENGIVSTDTTSIMDSFDVELMKKPGKGLGLSIVGKKTGPGIFISDIVAGGAAGVDGRLMKGDQILAVNGQDVRKASQEEAAAVLKTITGKIILKIGRLKARSTSSSDNDTISMEETRTVTMDRRLDGFGFSIVGGHGQLPVYVKTVFSGGAASASGLCRGDRILTVNGISVDGMSHDDVVSMLNDATPSVTLTLRS
ncbi:multiple PDZ domain protein-like [Daktulosphaira vitifoliae]|uniref:multiple PDZ domain protein-like n=1 Tax=Daktulosphaira vitifoliae TaxID=58002 RepID=UPI0021AA7DB8|nr:multiple PDZ domain protein-like [Daktulosphaira vitifoliae]